MNYISLSGGDFPHPARPANNVPVVFASDDNYVPYLGICMQSIAETGSESHNYDFIVLETRISPDSKRRLAENLARFKNVTLRFFNPHELISKVSFHTPSYYSEETYYRLFIQTIFQHYDKILYIDVDTIINRDVAELYDTDVENYLFAAALNSSTVSLVITNKNMHGYNWNDYLKNTLQLKDPYDYFQAGVLVANIQEIKKFDLQSKSLKKLEEIEPNFVDQDILNSVCDGHVKKLSMKWNFMYVFRSECNNVAHIDMLKEEDRTDYLEAEENPFLVHYAGTYSRPWQRPHILYAHLWWNVARRSVFYEEILFKNMMKKNAEELERVLLMRGVNHTLRRLNYFKYRYLAKLTFGDMQRKYRQKKYELKQIMRNGSL